MQLHQLVPTHPYKVKKRVGRGGKRGTYSGRGIKGQRARAGAKIRPAERDLISKLPKLRGVRFRSLKVRPVAINLDELDIRVPAGSTVHPRLLRELGLVSTRAGRTPPIKILGEGTLTKPLIIHGIPLSRQAREKIIAAGGKIIP